MQIDTSKWFTIVNPVAGKGNGLKDLPEISRLLHENDISHEIVFSQHRYHAVELTVDAVNRGYRQIIVIGGDGTIHEVVNGLFIQDVVKPQEVLISVVAVGTGNDWIRMFGIPRKYSESIRAISEGYSFLQDVGRISFNQARYNQHRYMANVAGVGFDAHVNRRFNQLKAEGRYSRWLYIWSTLRSVFTYNSTDVQIWVDDKKIADELVYSASVGIGKYNGGGMIQMPKAIADDGLLDLTTVRKLGFLGVLRRFKSLYNGRIYQIKQVSHDRGRKIRIESEPEIRIEIDGEALGFSPFEFEILDRAIRVVVSKGFLEREVDKRLV